MVAAESRSQSYRLLFCQDPKSHHNIHKIRPAEPSVYPRFGNGNSPRGLRMAKGSGRESTKAPITPEEGSASSPDSPSITLLVVDGPHDGLVFSDSATSATLGREVGNTIELPLDPQVSRDHCALQFSTKDECWILDDRGSANGTWYDGRRLSAPQPLEPEAEFVVGTSAIRYADSAIGHSFLPESARIEEGAQPLIERFDSTASQGFGAARMLALRERSPVLTDRHLFLGLISTNA